ncbi:MAG: prepilin-type N-terminal cleavage/methylation domain-containing protein [Parcubacteria group bacterium]|nr:prepilin-type N-terminal cleavage/methylation domain-containing protein [Parcubacteria group bacterium]
MDNFYIMFYSQRKQGETRGFTLIELLVVISIIGLLSAVVLASLNTARQKSRDAKRVADIKQLQLALELYFDDEGNYPANITDVGNLITPGYLPALPKDPTDDAVYPYTQLSSGADYHLGASLEDDQHVALDADVDADSTNVDGADADGCADEATRFCYDVAP